MLAISYKMFSVKNLENRKHKEEIPTLCNPTAH